MQKGAADFALGKLQPIIKTKVSIGKIRIKLFNRVELTDIYLEDQKQDTLLYAGSLTVRANFLDLLHNELGMQSVDLKNFVAKVYRETPTSPYNFQFLPDAFKSDKPKEPNPNPFRIYFQDIRLQNGTLSYEILSAPQTPGKFNTHHIRVKNLNARIAAPSIDAKKLEVNVRSLQFVEHCGLAVNRFQGKVRSKNSEFWSDRIAIVINNSDLEISEAGYDTKAKKFVAKLKSQFIDPYDIAFFTPRLSHLTKSFTLETEAEGQLPYINVKKLITTYGDETQIDISASIADYSKYNTSDIDIDIRKLKFSPDDLESFIRIGSPQYVSPQQLRATGNMDMHLTAKGKLSRFNYEGIVLTPQGNISLSGVGGGDKNFKNFLFETAVSTENILLANIIGEKPGINHVSLKTNTRVQKKEGSPIMVAADSAIVSFLYKEYRYEDVQFDGMYTDKRVKAKVFTDSEQNKLDLTADFSFGNEKEISVAGTIGKLYLTPLFTRKSWENPYLSANIEGHLDGLTMDDLVGSVTIDNLSLYDDNFIYNPGSIYLQATDSSSTSGKEMRLISSFLEAEITGEYRFSTIGNEFMTALHRHLPSFIELPEKKDNIDSLGNSFRFHIAIKNTEDLCYALSLPFYNVEPASISGMVNMAKQNTFQLNAYLPRLMFGKNDIRESRIVLENTLSDGIDVNMNSYLVQNNGYINVRLDSKAALDSVMNRLFFDIRNNVTNANGEMQVAMNFLRQDEENFMANIRIFPTDILFNKQTINIHPATIIYAKDSIVVNDFALSQGGMLLMGIGGIASKNHEDSIRVFFHNTELANLLTAFNISNIKGLLNGEIILSQALQEPELFTKDFRIDNIQLHNDTIGTLWVNGAWDKLKTGLNLDAFLMNKEYKYLDVTGFIPTGKKDSMDVAIKINTFPLEWVQPFARSIFSELTGVINAEVKIGGKLSQPLSDGWLGISNGIMKVAYTNVTYSISDTIQVNRNNIGFDNLIVKDNNGHAAVLNLELTQSDFGSMSYRVKMKLNDFLLLNNESRTDMMVYGNLKLSGDISLIGGTQGIYGDVNLWNESRSRMTIELPQTASASEYRGIIYINTPQEVDSLSFLRRTGDEKQNVGQTSSGFPINISGNIELDPQLDIKVLINPTTGDAITISGNGKLNVMYLSNADPPIRIYGEYIAQDGKVHYNLQSLKSIDFNLRKGSTLTFLGDPLNIQFNVVAYNQVTANLGTLSESFAYNSNLPTTRVPVNAVLEIQGNLQKMNLRYDIELPEASSDVQQKVKSLISTEEAKIRQFAYLVTTGNFYPAENTADVAIGNTMFTSVAASALTSGLDALFASALSDNWSISTNLETNGTQFDNIRMGVDVSTRLLNDKLRITTNLSYGDVGTLAGQQTFIGEFEAEYDINNWLMIRAYNHANERYYKRAPFTQGVGIIITKEGKTFSDLFRFRFVRKDENDVGDK